MSATQHVFLFADTLRVPDKIKNYESKHTGGSLNFKLELVPYSRKGGYGEACAVFMSPLVYAN